VNGWTLLANEDDEPMISHAKLAPPTINFNRWHHFFIDEINRYYLDENSPRRTAIDVGASVGMMSLPFAKYYEQVCSFEINPAIRHCFEENTKAVSNITMYNCGLSSANANLNVRIETFSGITHIDPDGDITLPVRKLDAFNFENVDLIKYDVEGHEIEAILGSKKTIARWKPLIIVEYMSIFRRDTKERQIFLRLMESLGYMLFDVRNHDLTFKEKQ
jgi:FkbM family methyltransferase